MSALIAECPDDVEEAVTAIASELRSILEAKRADVRWKLESVRRAYEGDIALRLSAARMSPSD